MYANFLTTLGGKLIDIVVMFASALITGLSVYIGSYYMMRKVKRELKQEAEAWLNSETGQKAIFSIGALLGHAIMQGTGFKRGSGKFKWQDVAVQVAMGYAQKMGLIPRLQQQGQTEEQSQDIKIGYP